MVAKYVFFALWHSEVLQIFLGISMIYIWRRYCTIKPAPIRDMKWICNDMYVEKKYY